ncbi:MAG: NAD(P)/FAD-dependent oxidoreductase [Defluviitaleaceae bacterium]|nr:NAD(P)/FAD-dependent oxidoreductase [Defluviitaleaceae bacterium]
MKSVIVIGGGPAGMMAAGTAAAQGVSVTLLEKNEKLGKKLHITGKGRCNLTNNSDVKDHMSNVVSNPRFLHSAFWAMDSQALMDFFEGQGVPLKTERGGRVFPVSDKAYDINDALRAYLKSVGVQVKLNHPVTDINQIKADAIIIATGGLSYPSTGSTGDGLVWAQALGHTITPTSPALVPLTSDEPWIPELEGLSLKNVKLRYNKYEEIGEMMFTKTGVTGPLVLSASAYMAGKTGTIYIDLKPGLTHEQLDARILRDFELHKNKDFANALDGLLPERLIETIVELSKINKKVHTITRQERQNLVHLLKNLEIPITGNAGYKEAVITQGGIDTQEINPSTMMSKKIPGLFFAGEVLDVDALTGGYNMQIAFSTGYLAGISVAKYIQKRE